ncbi:glutaminase domain-containing protein [Cohnella hongkongensis]|uniref:Glutaminase domain-containing protein n=1 Tax=Cohnella hongkongensis TaxID=178337 RepID=A0ABV9F8Y5_9BACL
MSFRPSAVPLITVDPYFSIWSFADCLYDDHTRHWTGQRNGMLGLLKVDGEAYRFMGKVEAFGERYYAEPQALPQIKLEVKPLTTIYTFANEQVELTLRFFTPLLPDRLALLSRPASYIEYDIAIKDGQRHDIEVYFDIAGECSVNTMDQKVVFRRGTDSVYCGNAEQKPLNASGDHIRIDWGYLHVAHPGAFVTDYDGRYHFLTNKEVARVNIDEAALPASEFRCIALISDKLSDRICLAYDDIKSIEYFGEPVDAYYKKEYGTFDNMLKHAVSDLEQVRSLGSAFEERLTEEAAKVSREYAEIAALAYRQTIAAHKLVLHDGELLFLSKECFSNGCIATLDVTYPSIPLFLKYNPELVKGMLRPILKYARSEAWTFDFAPHDCGQYPLCNGQVYGENKLEYQMPVEECGNMLLSVAALSRYEGSNEFALQEKPLLDKWADYLLEHGYDPGNQLCTDDFAGHLAHNCNLSMKAIVALGAYGKLMNERKYSRAAKEMADRWRAEARKDEGSLLAFDQPDSWSIKYNIVWDKLLEVGLFDREVYENEIRLYSRKMNRYGVPLDSRSDYTKLDWLAWTTVFTDNDEYSERLYKSIWDFINETVERVPITDWYYSSTPHQVKYSRYSGFQNRTVLGGVYINLLQQAHP